MHGCKRTLCGAAGVPEGEEVSDGETPPELLPTFLLRFWRGSPSSKSYKAAAMHLSLGGLSRELLRIRCVVFGVF
jgi:hypothetical protein